MFLSAVTEDYGNEGGVWNAPFSSADAIVTVMQPRNRLVLCQSQRGVQPCSGGIQPCSGGICDPSKSLTAQLSSESRGGWSCFD